MELVISLPIWLLVIQFIGAVANSHEFAPTFSLKKYLASTHDVEEVDVLSFNSFFVVLFATVFIQSLSIRYLLINAVTYPMALYFLMITATTFLGIFRFRLTLLRREAIELTQIVLSQIIIITLMILVWYLLQTNNILIKSIFILPFAFLFYSTELQLIKSGSIYTDKPYLEIKSSYVRLLYQGAFVLFVLNLLLTGSNLSLFLIEHFESSLVHFGVLSLLLIVFQSLVVILSNIYIKFQPFNDYSTLIKNSKVRVLSCLFLFIILCGSKAFNVF